ncbi:hypothetical protein ACFOYW_14760 [Gryllotalpicola reticulitermitis]|uniref:Uncharacterized protein n=1 Tax=Gryllotalpicola reticulitermitis TaxID=1184153 RepID=A0ABV8QAH0_9MICO
MPDRVKRYLLARLDPASRDFVMRVEVTFAASRRGSRVEEVFSAEWAELPDEHRRALVDVWTRLERSQALFTPRPTDGPSDTL